MKWKDFIIRDGTWCARSRDASTLALSASEQAITASFKRDSAVEADRTHDSRALPLPLYIM